MICYSLGKWGDLRGKGDRERGERGGRKSLNEEMRGGDGGEMR